MSILFAPFRAVENYFFPAKQPKDRLEQLYQVVADYAPVLKQYQNTALVAVGAPLVGLVAYKLATRNGGQLVDAGNKVLDQFVDALTRAIIDRIMGITFDKVIGFKSAENAARFLELDKPENMLRTKEAFADYLVKNDEPSAAINPLRDIRANQDQLEIKFAGFVNAEAKRLVQEQKDTPKLKV